MSASPNERASVETGDGIYYIDVGIEGNYKVRLLTYDLSGSTQVIPIPISNNIKLDSYNFDQGGIFRIRQSDLLCMCHQGLGPDGRGSGNLSEQS